jgi:hypothetical protein
MSISIELKEKCLAEINHITTSAQNPGFKDNTSTTYAQSGLQKHNLNIVAT